MLRIERLYDSLMVRMHPSELHCNFGRQFDTLTDRRIWLQSFPLNLVEKIRTTAKEFVM
jgi:hypothetical protein